jgi:hypothetical protein
MGAVTRADIEAAVKGVTGDPDVGTIAVIQNEIINAIDALINPAPVKENRIIKAEETRKPTND